MSGLEQSGPTAVIEHKPHTETSKNELRSLCGAK